MSKNHYLKIVCLLLFILVVYWISIFDPILAVMRYQYKNVTITRIDRERKTYFYFGNFPEDKNLPDDYILVTYKGRDSSMDGVLIFEKNGSVKVSPMSYSQQIGKVSKLILKKADNPILEGQPETTKIELGNSVSISNLIEVEKQKNIDNHSKVKVIYN